MSHFSVRITNEHDLAMTDGMIGKLVRRTSELVTIRNKVGTREVIITRA